MLFKKVSKLIGILSISGIILCINAAAARADYIRIDLPVIKINLGPYGHYTQVRWEPGCWQRRVRWIYKPRHWRRHRRARIRPYHLYP